MRKLMVVDDEQIIRDVIQDIVVMSCDDIIVETASSGEEALEMLHRQAYDMVFLDMKMKSVDGLQTYRQIRKIDANQKVFIITGYMDEEKSKQAVREGACGTLYKPFTVDDIVEILEKNLPKSKATSKAESL